MIDTNILFLIAGFLLGLFFAGAYLFFIEWMRPRSCWEPNNKDLPSFEERIKQIKKFELEKAGKK